MRRIGMIALSVILASTSTLAVDGQVLINQSTVTAAGGFPYRITQPGSYKLSGNLVVPGGAHAIVITADGVMFDLNGFSISGSGSGCDIFGSCTHQSIGISYSGSDTVRNGTVSGFWIGVGGFGIGVALTGRGIVEEIQATRNYAGIIVQNSLVRRNNASGNIQGLGGSDSSFLENIANSNLLLGQQRASEHRQ
jgi:hypothetical protein